MDILKVLKQARDSYSDYCIKECKALCCRKGYLVLKTEDELEAVTQGKRKQLEKKGLIKKLDIGYFLMTMEKVKCPSLDKNYKCKLFKNPKRPSLCRDFPVMVVGNYIITSPICPAVNEGKLNPFLKKLEKEGYKII